MSELEDLLKRFETERTLQLTEQLLRIREQIRGIMGAQFQVQVDAWEEAFAKVCAAQNCGIIEASIGIARKMSGDGIPGIPICVMFASAIELLIIRGKK